MTINPLSVDTESLISCLSGKISRELNPEERAVLELSQVLRSQDVTDVASLDERSIKELRDNLLHITTIFSKPDPVKELSDSPEELPSIFYLAVNGKIPLKDTQLKDIFDKLVRFAGEKKLKPEDVSMIIQGADAALKKGLLKEDDVYHPSTEINKVALYSKSEPFYLNSQRSYKDQGKMMMPEGIDINDFKDYIEEGILPDFSELETEDLIYCWNAFEEFLFPSDIKDQILSSLIDKISEDGVIEQPTKYPKPVEYLERCLQAVPNKKEALDTLKDLGCFIFEFPVETRIKLAQEVLPNAFTILSATTEREKKMNMIRAFLHVPAEAYHIVGKLLSLAKSKEEVDAFIGTIEKLPEGKQTVILENAMTILNGFTSDEKTLNNALLVIGLVKRLSPNVYGTIISSDEFRRIPDKACILKLSSPLITDELKPDEFMHIVLTVFNRSPERRERVVQLALALIKPVHSFKERIDILNYIDRISSLDNAEKIIEETTTYLKGIKDAEAIVGVIDLMWRIEPSERKQLIEDAVFVLEDPFVDVSLKNEILRILAYIPRNQRTPDLLEAVRFFFRNIDNKAFSEMGILFMMSSSPELVEAIKLSSTFFSQNSIGNTQALICLIKTFPPEARDSNAFRQVEAFLRDIDSVTYVCTVGFIEEGKKAEGLQRAMGLLQGVNDLNLKREILEAAAFVPVDERDQVFNEALNETSMLKRLDILENSHNENYTNQVYARYLFSNVVSYLPVEERTPEVLSSIQEFCEGKTKDEVESISGSLFSFSTLTAMSGENRLAELFHVYFPLVGDRKIDDVRELLMTIPLTIPIEPLTKERAQAIIALHDELGSKFDYKISLFENKSDRREFVDRLLLANTKDERLKIIEAE